MENRVSRRFSPEYALLGFLYQAPSHGYELHQRLREQLGFIWNASQSQTYNILKRLESQGYIQAVDVKQDKHPKRRQIQLTSSGNERFISWLNLPTKPSVHAIRLEFITRLYFHQLYFPEKAPKMIHDQLEILRVDVRRLQQQLKKIEDQQSINKQALGLRLELLSSMERWLEGCCETNTTEHL